MEKKVIYIREKKEQENTAGDKAPNDIGYLCAKRGYREFVFLPIPERKNKLFQKIWMLFMCNIQWKKLQSCVDEKCIVLYQHPTYGIRVAVKWISKIKKRKKCRFIALIHDLESLRRGIGFTGIGSERRNRISDNNLLRKCDVFICHNEQMRRYLIQNGFEEKKLINLEIFDYLSDCRCRHEQMGDTPSVMVAGNLVFEKSKYIYEILAGNRNVGLKVHLYGNNFRKELASDRLIWHGSFKPEELPEHLTGDYGLVWDGTSAETCEGNTGRYLLYNTPHKTSLYLASGFPVIVWRQAAIADFIVKNKVGIAVDSLADLEGVIRAVTEEEYGIMCKNVRVISERLRGGYYFYRALDRALKLLQDGQVSEQNEEV